MRASRSSFGWIRSTLPPKSEEPEPTPSTPELAIPEGSIMLEDFSDAVTDGVPDHNWSSGNEAFKYYPELDGKAGVLALGFMPTPEGETTNRGYYTNIGMNNLNLDELESIIFRVKISSGITLMWIGDEANDDYVDVNSMMARDEWIEVTLPMSAVSHWKNRENFTITFEVQINGNISEESYYLWIDQIYATPKV